MRVLRFVVQFGSVPFTLFIYQQATTNHHRQQQPLPYQQDVKRFNQSTHQRYGEVASKGNSEEDASDASPPYGEEDAKEAHQEEA